MRALEPAADSVVELNPGRTVLPEPNGDLVDSLELVRRAQGNDEEAMNRLLLRYYPRVRRIIRMRLGVKLRAHVDAEDICQETLRDAVQEFDCFEVRGELSLIHWLGKLAENRIRRAAEYHGAQKRDHGRETPLVSDDTSSTGRDGAGDLAAEQASPLEEVIQREDSERIEICLDEISERHRDAITLRLEGASFAEIAECLGCPTANAASMLWARATAKLMEVWSRLKP